MTETNTWDSILQSISHQESHREATIIFLGDPESGKHSLYHAISDKFGNKQEFDYQGGHVIDYTSYSVPSQEDRRLDEDEFALLHVWFLNDPRYQGLLKSSLKVEMLEHTIFVICIDYSKTWDIMNSLQSWTEVVESLVKDCLDGLTIEKQSSIKQSMMRYVMSAQQYSKEIQNLVIDPSATSDVMPEALLTKNIGIPMCICLTKTDAMVDMKREIDADIRFSFIQKHIRSFAIQYGSYVFYTSAHSGINITELKDTLLHRVYPDVWKYDVPYQVVDADRIIIPSGWDSLYLISQLVNSKSIPEDSNYSTYIHKPLSIDTLNDSSAETTVEDEQTFLKALLPATKTAPLMVVKNTAGMTSPHDGGARPGVSRPTNATDFFKSLKNRTVKSP